MSKTTLTGTITNSVGTPVNTYYTTSLAPPPMLGLRQFLRGGYRDLDVPTVIYDVNHKVVGTWVPGTIDSDVKWSEENPDWLGR